MRTRQLPREEKLKRIKEVVIQKTDNVIHVDFVFISLYEAINQWYDKYFRDDPHGLIKRGHLFQLSRMYDRRKFKNHNTLGQERDKFLEDLDLIIQMRRHD